MEAKAEWFEEWFDTEEYHLLYGHRDHEEADNMIDAFARLLALKPGDSVLDLACGRGRHSQSLFGKGFQVTGLDLSLSNIQFAQKSRKPQIDFVQHDMRLPFPVNGQKAVFNLFTSFGYFDTLEEHLLTLKHIKNCLAPGGHLIIDYFNAGLLKSRLVTFETKVGSTMTFTIRRYISEGKIMKEITFLKNNQPMKYTESVQLFMLSDFNDLLEQAGFESIACFGDYTLTPYEEKSSSRLIIKARRPLG